MRLLSSQSGLELRPASRRIVWLTCCGLLSLADFNLRREQSQLWQNEDAIRSTFNRRISSIVFIHVYRQDNNEIFSWCSSTRALGTPKTISSERALVFTFGKCLHFTRLRHPLTQMLPYSMKNTSRKPLPDSISNPTTSKLLLTAGDLASESSILGPISPKICTAARPRSSSPLCKARRGRKRSLGMRDPQYWLADAKSSRWLSIHDITEGSKQRSPTTWPTIHVRPR